MSEHPVANGHAPEPAPNPEVTANGSANKPQQTAPKRSRPKKKGPNYAQIHSKPLPVEVHPLPAFHPSHPLSLLHLCYVYISQLLSPPSSHPAGRYVGYFSWETRSVHVTDPVHIRALWEMGFFGKGTLSRSEPSWLEREKARVKAVRGGRGGGTAEEATNARREERRMFKLERARVERERIERQRAVEEGRMTVEEAAALEAGDEVKPAEDGAEAQPDAAETVGQPPDQSVEPSTEPVGSATQAIDTAGRVPDAEILDPAVATTPLPEARVADPATTAPTAPLATVDNIDEAEPNIKNQEHLQLTLEEAFFLSYGLGALDVTTFDTHLNPTRLHTIHAPSELLTLFSQHSVFPPLKSDLSAESALTAPDSPFLLNYAVYHHFRSLGWVVRPGVKFAVDYLLYNRGPVFSHAEFGVLVLPAYTHSYWSTSEGLKARRVKEQKDWWWLHCVNRVQSQVRKTLVLCYVDVPPPLEGLDVGGLRDEIGKVDVSKSLRRYKVREFVIKRWLANRSRD
ncbi:hypothetical protein LTR85_011591 [Meristemomyces frigidus]|nr:hypothetical protein LTR85_011591 [Meristemomyces frigidus]